MSVAIAPKRRLPTFPGNEQGSVFETFNKIGKRLVPYADLQCLKKTISGGREKIGRAHV